MKSTLLLILHFHQPVGNFDSVIERVCDRCYGPFLDLAARHTEIKFNLHISGCLMDWFSSRNPAMIESIRALLRRGSAELVGGAMYEPIFSVVSPEDVKAQIKLMQKESKRLFGSGFKSAWVPERVWEPSAVSVLAESGVESVILDDTHLLYAGLRKEDTYGYYVTEDNGRALRVFASDKPLRYSMPFKAVDVSIGYMKKVASSRQGPLFTYGDDVEKFGEWPGTYKSVYEDGWLNRFFEGIAENRDWLVTSTISEYIEKNPPLGRIYIPAASYEEMNEWAMPLRSLDEYSKFKNDLKKHGLAEKAVPFLRGGYFRNFLVKYNEADQLHKRMLYAADRLRQAKMTPGGKDYSEASRRLYKGQCNCAYWHGVFGGLYLYHLRKALYDNILQAERDTLEAGKRCITRFDVTDFDADGLDEVILYNKDVWLCSKPSLGGALTELDALYRHHNITNTMGRYREHYSRGEEGQPAFDTYRRCMFTDHLAQAGFSLEDFERGDFTAHDLSKPFWNFGLKGKELILKSPPRCADGVIEIEKRISLKKRCLSVGYSLKKKALRGGTFFLTEMPFIMPDADSGRYLYIIGSPRSAEEAAIKSRGESTEVEKVEVVDTRNELGLILEFSPACGLWRFPIYTVSRSESGTETNYQGSVTVARWELGARRIDRREFKIRLILK